MRAREVVVINPDGSVRVKFGSVKEASERMGVSCPTLLKRLRIMGLVKGYNIRHHYRIRGFTLIYAMEEIRNECV